jgi:processive 1,2-diacylglycerol beta-glucosyltransferase
MSKKILLAGASFGWGHAQAVNNVATAILDYDVRCSIQKIDVLDFLPPGVKFFCKSSWRWMSSNLRGAYSFFYNSSVNHAWSQSSVRVLAQYAESRIVAASLSPPDIFVATHSFAVPIGSLMKQHFKCKLCVVITDFTLHKMQIVPEVDYFFVPPAYECKESLNLAKRVGSTTLDTGIPISIEFSIGKDVGMVKKRLGLSSTLTTVLVSFGGSGLRAERHTHIFSELLDSNLPLQFVVLAGHNVKFAQAVRERYAMHRHSGRVKVYNFLDDVSDFYTVADLFVGKAGGLSISEALAAGLPITIVDFLPGQEEANVRVLTSNGLGTYVKNIDELKLHIEALLNAKTRGRRSTEIHEFARPFSSKTIAMSLATLTS